jgi:putative addiction module component (TIGR02574 family)
MGPTLTKDEILRLPVEARLELIAAIWDSIPAEQLRVPESHRRSLDEALSEHARDPEAGQSWQEVRDETLSEAMTFSLRVRARARDDIRGARDWYEKQSVGLGDRFLSKSRKRDRSHR